MLAATLGEEEPLAPEVLRLIARLEEFGITRLAETTRLDRIGVRTHSATKPGTADVISIYSGKGLTVSDSVRSAIMECLERTGSLWDPALVTVCSAEQAAALGKVVEPVAFTEPSAHLDPRQPIGWVWADPLDPGPRVLVPAQLAFNGRPPPTLGCLPFTVSTSNGLGAGFDPRSAAVHGMRELIERDVLSCVELLSSHIQLNQLHRLARSLGITLDTDSLRDSLDHVVRVDVDSLPEPASTIVERLRIAGLPVELKALPNDLGVPCFAAATAEERGPGKVLATAGYAAGYPLGDAVVRALLEVCQSRATHSQGGREDDSVVAEKRLHRTIDASTWLFNSGLTPIAFDDVASHFLPGEDTLACYADRLETSGLGSPLIVRWNPHPGVYVARVLVPGIETWHATAGESRLGPRMERARRAPQGWVTRHQRQRASSTGPDADQSPVGVTADPGNGA